MYFSVLLTVAVILNSVNNAEISANVPEEPKLPVVSALPRMRSQNISVIENSTFHFKVTDLPSERLTKDIKQCSGACNVNALLLNYSSCSVSQNEPPYYLDVTIGNYHISKNDINWTCLFDMVDPAHHENPVHSEAYFQLNILKPPDKPGLGPQELIYIVAAVVILVILIFIGQTICIVHFRRKAKAVRMHASLSKRNESIEETVRYSKMPGQKLNVEPCDEARESCIYEVLEDLRVPPVPEPPSLKTLPRPGARNRATSPATPAEPAPSASAVPRTLTNGTLLPFALRKKQAKDSGSGNKRTTIERIKDRAPMPIPDEDIYEAMDSTPPPIRKEYPKTTNQVQKKELFGMKEFAKKDTLPKTEIKKKGYTLKPKPALPSNVKNGPKNSQNPQILPSQLKEAFELRNRGNPLETGAARVIPFNPGLPPPVATSSKPSAIQPPRPTGPARPWAGRAPPPGPNATGPAATGPAATGPGATGPDLKWRPPPPIKPKQLHPLPHLPESIHDPADEEEADGCSSDEEWIYEPLEDPSSYNIYSNT